jgi:Tannase and feruloyl esterase
MRCRRFAAAVVCLLAASTAQGQSGAQFKDWNLPSDEVRLKSKLACADLRSLTGFEFSVVTANTIAANADAPEHCRVSGQILPEVSFEVNLPASWNRRLYMFGNGGFAGEPFEAPRRIAQRNLALQRGFAVVSTNTGHDAASEPMATFTASRQKLIDFAFRSVHATAETAKALIRTYYGKIQSHAYFDGSFRTHLCSLRRKGRAQRRPHRRPPQMRLYALTRPAEMFRRLGWP